MFQSAGMQRFEIREAVDKELRANWVALGEEAVTGGMEHEAAGRYIPVSL